jgi:RND family efflux transporter MFP subunit
VTPGQAALTARVTAVFPFVDPGARTAVVEAIVDNPERRFLPGQYVTMQFVTGDRSGALTVPVRAVARMGATATVWVVKGDRAEPRPVTTGLEDPQRVEITRGLTGDEQVVWQGREGLYAGAPVKEISNAAAPAPPAPEGAKAMPDMPGMKDVQPAVTPKEAPHGQH